MSQTPDFRVGADLAADPVLAPPTASESASKSPLEALRESLAAPVVKPPVVLRVPSRPGITVEYRTTVSQEERKAWMKRATKKKRGTDEVDELFFAQLVIANTCQAILIDGTAAHDAEDTPLTFAHRQLWEMVGAHDTAQAVRLFYGIDPHILLTSGEILLSSGFDDEITDEEGPTE